MNQRSYLLSLLVLLLGAFLWSVSGAFSESELVAVLDRDPSAPSPSAEPIHDHGSAVNRTALEQATRDGFYGAPVGSLLSWRFRHTTSYGLETRPEEGGQITATPEQMSIPFHGVLHMQILARAEDVITVLVQGTEVGVSLPADADERGMESARSYCDALETWFLVRVDTRGTPKGYAFQDGINPQQRNLVRAVIAGFFHTIPEAPPGNWDAREADATGEYTAVYRLLTSGPTGTEIERVKRSYESIGALATPPEHTLSGRSRARFDPETGWLANVQIDESMMMEVSEFPSRVHLHVEAEFEIVSSDWRGITIEESEWPSFVSASGAGEDLTSATVADERDEWRVTTAEISLDELLAQLRALIEAGETQSEAFYETWLTLSWKLILDPEAVAAAEKLLLGMSLDEETGSMLLSALGKAGSEEAQNALLTVYGEPGLEDGWRKSAAFSMFQLAEPTPEVLQVVSNRLKDVWRIDGLDATSVLLLGTLAPRNQLALPSGETAMAVLLGFEGRARDLGGTRLWLEALGNAAVPQVAPYALRYLNHNSPSVRESAVLALDQSGAQGIAPQLIEVARTDPQNEVRICAIDALGKRESEAGRQAVRELALEASNAGVRHAAIMAIGGRPTMDPQDRAVLQRVAGQDPIAGLREAAQRLLDRS